MIFEPVAYDHAAFLINKTPYEVSRSAELLSEAQINSLQTYNYNISVVGVDIYNIEAEIYGCKIGVADTEAMPSVEEPISDKVEDILKLDLNPETSGRLPLIFNAAKIIKEKHPEYDVRIPISGPYTIACHLIGFENMICSLMDNTELAVGALNHLADNQIKIVREAVKKGFGISLFESAAAPPLLSPRLYKKFASAPIEKIFEVIKNESKDKGQFIIGGNTLPIQDAILNINSSYIICPAETDQKLFIENIPHEYTENGNIIRINMKPSSFLHGKDEAIAEAQRAYTLSKGRKNITVGSLIPYNADKDTVIAVRDFLASK